MKKYFTKWLPVEGEIEEGDKFSADGRIYTFFGFDGTKSSVNTVESGYIYHSANNSAQEWLSKRKKVKLFLCSSDIQVGSTIRFEGDIALVELSHYCESEYHLSRLKNSEATFFSVIGEISPEATWITEGMELTEDQIKIISRINPENGEEMFEWDVVQVKGPCGFFH